MPDSLRDKLVWFLKNLDLLLEDFELENQSLSVNQYFDTLDIKHTVLGLEAFYYAGKYDVQGSFQPPQGRPLRDRTLVLCLAFSGRLGTIRMLPPHQAEFLAGLNKDFGVHEKLAPKQMVQQFLEAVSQTESIKRETSVLKDADEQKTLEYVRQHAGSAANFFKIIQLVRGITWRERFVNLRQTGTLALESYKIGYDEIVESDEFQTFYKTFSRLRKTRSAANFADAVALTILARAVENVKAEKSKSVPRFYVSSESVGARPLFFEAVEQSGLEHLFFYGQTNRTSVLRESDYFIFRSIFETPNGFKGDDANDMKMSDPRELLALRRDVSSILESSLYIRPEQVADINFLGKNITQVIDDLNTFLFFTNVWLPSSRQEIDLAVQDLTAAADELKSQSFTQTVGEGIAEAKAILVQNVAQYELIRRMWEEIEAATRSLGDLKVPEDIDYSRDFGLLRFSFPESAYGRINQVLGDLLTGTPEDAHLTHSNVITACYMAHILPQEKYIDDVAAAAAVLWVAERYRELVKLLAEIDPLPHYSLELIFAAAVFEFREQEARGQEILSRLYARYLDATDPSEKSNLAVGLAYLNFHYWRLLGHGPSWDREAGEPTPESENGKELIDMSMELALEAFTSLSELDMRKKVYALNQYLYYMVMADDPSLSLKLSKVADRLLRYKEQGDRDWWQHRFDDTLARYFYSLAVSSDNPAGWNLYISKAIEYSLESHIRAPWDRVTKAFMDRLQNRKDRKPQRPGRKT